MENKFLIFHYKGKTFGIPEEAVVHIEIEYEAFPITYSTEVTLNKIVDFNGQKYRMIDVERILNPRTVIFVKFKHKIFPFFADKIDNVLLLETNDTVQSGPCSHVYQDKDKDMYISLIDPERFTSMLLPEEFPVKSEKYI